GEDVEGGSRIAERRFGLALLFGVGEAIRALVPREQRVRLADLGHGGRGCDAQELVVIGHELLSPRAHRHGYLLGARTKRSAVLRIPSGTLRSVESPLMSRAFRRGTRPTETATGVRGFFTRAA